MKLFTRVFLFLNIFFFILACTRQVDDQKQSLIEFDKLEVPSPIADNIEVIDFFNSSEKYISQMSDKIKILFFTNRELLIENKDLDKADSMDLAKVKVEYVINGTKMARALDGTQKFIENAKANGFDETQIQSLEIMQGVMVQRVAEVHMKYNDYFK